MSTNRRTFIGAVSAATAGILAGNNQTAYAQTSGKGKREPGKLLRIGVLTCHPTHHHMPNIYGPIIQCVARGNYVPTRMMITAFIAIRIRPPTPMELLIDVIDVFG